MPQNDNIETQEKGMYWGKSWEIFGKMLYFSKILGKIQNFPDIFSRFFPVWAKQS